MGYASWTTKTQTTTVLLWKLLVLGCWAIVGVVGQNNDIFNYGLTDINENGMTSRGQPNWNQVRCGNAEICVSLTHVVAIVDTSIGGHRCVPTCLFSWLTTLKSISDWFSQQIPSSAAKLFVLQLGY